MTRRKRRNFPSTTTENGTNEKVKLVMGDYRNIKVTTPEDMTVAAAFLDDLKKM